MNERFLGDNMMHGMVFGNFLTKVQCCDFSKLCQQLSKRILFDAQSVELRR